MRIASLVLLIAAASLRYQAHAQEAPSATPQCVADVSQITDENCYKAPMSPIISAFTQAGMSSIKTSVHLRYDDKGYITAATLNRSTKNKKLDAAIVEWAKLNKLMPGAAGEGDLPVEIGIH